MEAPHSSDALAFVLVKAFGDLVIAHTSLSRASEAPCRLLIAPHLLELAQALGPAGSTEVDLLDLRERAVPALFDVKKAGLARALASAASLRRSLKAAHKKRETLVFDKLGGRERWIAGRARAAALPVRANIYLAYEACLSERGGTSQHGEAATQIRRVGLFPGSRVAAKSLPLDVLTRALQTCRDADVEAIVFLLDGERPDLELALADKRIVPRSFGAMVDAVRSVDAIVSADSMPAHLAEAAGLPVFVISPVANRYWLPLSAFHRSRWALFEEVQNGKGPLAAFLASHS